MSRDLQGAPLGPQLPLALRYPPDQRFESFIAPPEGALDCGQQVFEFSGGCTRCGRRIKFRFGRTDQVRLRVPWNDEHHAAIGLLQQPGIVTRVQTWQQDVRALHQPHRRRWRTAQ